MVTRGHSHRGYAATAVKMQPKGQGTSWELVKRLSGVLGPISSTAGSQDQKFVNAQLINTCTGQGKKFTMIKAFFGS